MEMALNKIVPENFPYVHTAEGPDDMVNFVNHSRYVFSFEVFLFVHM
jgi:hypothetical protein